MTLQQCLRSKFKFALLAWKYRQQILDLYNDTDRARRSDFGQLAERITMLEASLKKEQEAHSGSKNRIRLIWRFIHASHPTTITLTHGNVDVIRPPS